MVRDNTLCPIFKAAPFFDCTSVFLRKKKFFSEEKQWNTRTIIEETVTLHGQNQSESFKTSQGCTSCIFLPYLRLDNHKK
ncbi:MAG: hypothetical protein BGO40_05370 [Chryseobacterium sp. 39-10]|nr:MAG: hypothetical protein BGO40_05370 [Chryseobacterium sp. 39-10]